MSDKFDLKKTVEEGLVNEVKRQVESKAEKAVFLVNDEIIQIRLRLRGIVRTLVSQRSVKAEVAREEVKGIINRMLWDNDPVSSEDYKRLKEVYVEQNIDSLVATVFGHGLGHVDMEEQDG